LRRIGAQQVGAPFDGDVVFFRKFVDALQADIAPGSNVIVPNDHVHRIGVVRMAVGWRLGGHGFLQEWSGGAKWGGVEEAGG